MHTQEQHTYLVMSGIVPEHLLNEKQPTTPCTHAHAATKTLTSIVPKKHEHKHITHLIFFTLAHSPAQSHPPTKAVS